MTTSKKGIDLIKSFEACKLQAYPDPGTGGQPITIGWGSTRYEDGKRIGIRDFISQAEADKLLSNDLLKTELKINELLRDTPVTQNQFDALVSFAYNVGITNLAKSTLLKMVREDNNDPNIYAQFLKWNKANGKVMNGLTRRRKAEAELYFTH